MKYILSCDFLFEVEANDEDEAIEKGWFLIHEELPERFSTEASELQIFD